MITWLFLFLRPLTPVSADPQRPLECNEIHAAHASTKWTLSEVNFHLNSSSFMAIIQTVSLQDFWRLKSCLFTYILRSCLDFAVVWRNECCLAITFPRFNSTQQMVNVNHFLFLPIFHLPFSFNTISFYLGWYLSA